MKELRLTLVAALFALPLAWSSALVAETRIEMTNQALGALLVGALPLLGAMLFWGETFHGADLDVRYGQSRRRYAARRLGRSLVTLVVASLTASTTALFVLRGLGDPLLTRDLLSTSAIAIAGGVSLGAFFGASRAWLGRGGLLAALLATWIVAPLNFVVSAAVPTGHVRFLLGLGAELPFPGWVSFACLYSMAAALCGLLFLRIPR